MADALDPATLDALWGEGLLDAALAPGAPPLPPHERAVKRLREAELSLDAHLAFEAGARAPGDAARDAPADSGGDDDCGAGAGRGRRGSSGDGAAKAKAKPGAGAAGEVERLCELRERGGERGRGGRQCRTAGRSGPFSPSE